MSSKGEHGPSVAPDVGNLRVYLIFTTAQYNVGCLVQGQIHNIRDKSTTSCMFYFLIVTHRA